MITRSSKSLDGLEIGWNMFSLLNTRARVAQSEEVPVVMHTQYHVAGSSFPLTPIKPSISPG